MLAYSLMLNSTSQMSTLVSRASGALQVSELPARTPTLQLAQVPLLQSASYATAEARPQGVRHNEPAAQLEGPSTFWLASTLVDASENQSSKLMDSSI